MEEWGQTILIGFVLGFVIARLYLHMNHRSTSYAKGAKC